MSSASEVLDHAVAVLGRGEALTFDAVAREAGLTKPGVVHHFATKEILASSVVGRVIDRWEAGLTAHARDADGAVEVSRAPKAALARRLVAEIARRIASEVRSPS